jgi:hypothetical protein
MARRARSRSSACSAIVAALAALGLFAPAPARAQTFPADAQWVSLKRSGAVLTDIAADGGATGRDIVGSAALPAGYFYGDGSFLYFRLRINDTVLQAAPANFKQAGWVCLLDIDGNLQSYELSAGLNGNTDLVELRSNTTPGNTGSPNDLSETLLKSYPVPAYAREAPAASTFGANPDFFVDWAVSQADLANAGVGPATALRFICGSSSNAQNLATDLITSTGATTLTGLATDPIACGFSGCDYACPGLGQPCTTGVGACQTSGVLLCNGQSDFCSVFPGEPGPEECNAIDDDCDGETDEDFDLGAACSVGIGACVSQGVLVCDGMGGATCSVFPGEPGPEECNAIDDDCDGETDEDFDLGTACSVGVGACEAVGARICDGMGSATCSATAGAPTDETCNGVDDDCNGVTDEGFDLGAACSAGLGACETQGALECDGMGGTTCNAQPGAPTDETCNGVDDDCDGMIDDGTCITCTEDADCGGPKSGTVCDAAADACIPGCRGTGGNGCLPHGQTCTSTDTTIGACVDVPTECQADGDCGAFGSGRVCDLQARTCIDGCRGAGGNVCPAGFTCSSETGAIGTCSPVPVVYFEGNGISCGFSRTGERGTSAGALATTLCALALLCRRRRRRRAR